jgi:hypothetical protein
MEDMKDMVEYIEKRGLVEKFREEFSIDDEELAGHDDLLDYAESRLYQGDVREFLQNLIDNSDEGKEATRRISKILAEAEKLIDEATKIADEAGVTFNFNDTPYYGQNGPGFPYEYYEGQTGWWQPSVC